MPPRAITKFEKPGPNVKTSKIKNYTKPRLHEIETGEICKRCECQDMTIRPAHYEGKFKYRYGKGYGKKCVTEVTVLLCQRCTDIMDKKPEKNDELAREKHDNEWAHLIIDTQIQANAKLRQENAELKLALKTKQSKAS